MIKREGAVLAPAERNQAVIIIFSAVGSNQLIQFQLLGGPVNLALFDFVPVTDVANSFFVKGDGLVCFRLSAVTYFHQLEGLSVT